MEFFKRYFKETDFEDTNLRGEVQVLCPFPHSFDSNGQPSYEKHPSAGINTETNLFHCFTCNQGLTEVQFIAKMNNISIKEASVLLNNLEQNATEEEWDTYHKALMNDEEKLNYLFSKGFSKEAIEQCKIGYSGVGIMTVPVIMNNTLMDMRTYTPDEKPKWKSQKGALAGLIVPFDLWINDPRPTVLCAGEKDMLMARSQGYNAITVTGGELAVPKYFKSYFLNKLVFIVYDNDETGKNGARNVASFIKECGGKPYVCEGHHKVCIEKGEDLYDFFIKYNKTKEDMNTVLNSGTPFDETQYKKERLKKIPVVSLTEAREGSYRNKRVSSLVQITSVFDTQYSVADYVEFEKIASLSDKDTMSLGEKRHYYLEDYNTQQILYLMEEENKVNNYYRSFVHIPSKEGGITMRKRSYATVFKASVIDYRESDVIEGDNFIPTETMAFIINKDVQNGKKYLMTYKMVAHPLDDQRLVMVVDELEEADNSVSDFVIDDSVKQNLSMFQGEPFAKMEEFLRRGKSIVGKFAMDKIFFTTDLYYHTPLQFNYGNRLTRGYLDVMIIGETRTGKSKTAESLLKLYQLGTFLSLKTSTTVGLIGGSKNTNGGGWKNTIGAIPRNHEGAVIMEEFQGAPENFISSITDIRTSNKVRIVRADGELVVDAKVRMLTLSNQQSTREGTKPLRSYPNGVEVVRELVGASEDISRYDFFALVEEPSEYTSPFAESDMLDAFPVNAYQDRVRWAWSRKPENIIFEEGVEKYIWEQAQALNATFNCHIKFFGSEADLKLARVSVATASCVCSTDNEFQNVIVKKEHVDWAVQWFNKLYDNGLFRLKEYADEERSYAEVDDELVKVVANLYNGNTVLLSQLEHTSSATRGNLQAVSGLDTTSFGAVINELTRFKLIKWQSDKIIPTERFRKSMRLITRGFTPPRLGES